MKDMRESTMSTSRQQSSIKQLEALFKDVNVTQRKPRESRVVESKATRCCEVHGSRYKENCTDRKTASISSTSVSTTSNRRGSLHVPAAPARRDPHPSNYPRSLRQESLDTCVSSMNQINKKETPRRPIGSTTNIKRSGIAKSTSNLKKSTEVTPSRNAPLRRNYTVGKSMPSLTKPKKQDLLPRSMSPTVASSNKSNVPCRPKLPPLVSPVRPRSKSPVYSSAVRSRTKSPLLSSPNRPRSRSPPLVSPNRPRSKSPLLSSPNRPRSKSPLLINSDRRRYKSPEMPGTYQSRSKSPVPPSSGRRDSIPRLTSSIPSSSDKRNLSQRSTSPITSSLDRRDSSQRSTSPILPASTSPVVSNSGRRDSLPRSTSPVVSSSGRRDSLPRSTSPAVSSSGGRDILPRSSSPAPSNSGRRDSLPKSISPSLSSLGRHDISPRSSSPILSSTAQIKEQLSALGNTPRKSTSSITSRMTTNTRGIGSKGDTKVKSFSNLGRETRMSSTHSRKFSVDSLENLSVKGQSWSDRKESLSSSNGRDDAIWEEIDRGTSTDEVYPKVYRTLPWRSVHFHSDDD